MEHTKLVIGFITYGEATAKYLPHFLPSLLAQDYKDFKILAVDNTAEEINSNSEYIKNYPQIELKWTGENLGFARAYDLMIKQAVETGAEYFFALNDDMILAPNMITEMLKIAEQDNNIASVTAKTLYWNFAENKKTDIIDSCGLKLTPGLKFYDIGQGEIDRGQYDNKEIFGVGGAAALYRVEALQKVAEDGKYFDELMFMYKEDCDLAYRLHLAGYKAKLASQAIAYHDRSISAQGESSLQIALNRKNKSQQNKSWSFLHQNIIFLKYWRRQSYSEKMAIIWWEMKMIIFALFFERYLLGEFVKLWKIRDKIRYY